MHVPTGMCITTHFSNCMPLSRSKCITSDVICWIEKALFHVIYHVPSFRLSYSNTEGNVVNIYEKLWYCMVNLKIF